MKLQQLRDFLKGKKTYITAAIGILGALAAWSDGQINGVGFATAVWAALQTCFIRAGLGNELAKPQ